MYADLDFWLALLKDDDWLSDRAEHLLEEHEGKLEVSLATFIELLLVEERYTFDRERAVTAILELATYSGDPDDVYQASEHIDEGLNTFDGFHAALSGGRIVSSDGAYDDIGSPERIRLEPDGGVVVDTHRPPQVDVAVTSTLTSTSTPKFSATAWAVSCEQAASAPSRPPSPGRPHPRVTPPRGWPARCRRYTTGRRLALRRWR